MKPRHSKQVNRKALEAMGFKQRKPVGRQRVIIWLADHKRIWRVIAWWRIRKEVREERAKFDKVDDAEQAVSKLRPKTLIASFKWKKAYKPPTTLTDELRPNVTVEPTRKVK